jgi:hypothetical protein
MAEKQQALVNAIADGVHAKTAPELAKLAEQVARMMVSVNGVLARLEVIESTVTAGGAPKRATRAGGAKAGAKKAAAKKGTAGDDKSKVTNALLYYRYSLANDLDDARATYGTDENIAEAEKDGTVQKRDIEKDPHGYWSAVGAALWKSVLSEEDKETIRASYTAWKEQALSDENGDQLNEEN